MAAKYMIIMSTVNKNTFSNSAGKAEILYAEDITEETLAACVTLSEGHYSKDTLVIVELGAECPVSSEIQIEIEKKAVAKAAYNTKMALEIATSLEKHKENKEEPYLLVQGTEPCSCGCEHTEKQSRKYNPAYGDDRLCICGHPYYRHFDSYEDNAPVGCKYCSCYTFTEAKSVTELKEKDYY